MTGQDSEPASRCQFFEENLNREEGRRVQAVQDFQPSDAPPRAKGWRARLPVALAGVLVIVVSAAFLFSLGLTGGHSGPGPQPRITLSDERYLMSGCGPSGPFYHTFVWLFNLTNSGSADGRAGLTFYVNGSAGAYRWFLVTANTTLPLSMELDGPTYNSFPCPNETPTIAITSVVQA